MISEGYEAHECEICKDDLEVWDNIAWAACQKCYNKACIITEEDKRLIASQITSVFGIKTERIQKILDFFRKNGFEPDKDDFEKELERRKIV